MSDLEEHIIESMRLRDDILDDLIPSGATPRLRNRIGWARNYLKHGGFVENSSGGVWILTRNGHEALAVNPAEITRRARSVIDGSGKPGHALVDEFANEEDAPIEGAGASWRDQLRQTLLNMSPGDFERLAKRILDESGFSDVVVTGQSGDGGIDGHGMFSFAGLVKFPISFQCKRYTGSVGPGLVREFRGSLGRQAERGLLITTATFTPSARQEAMREGAVFIDLMDGEALMDKLKELKLGVNVEMVEQTTVDVGWWEANYGVSV